jgi:RNA polymerase sigma factor for flagellar operon FliA
MRFAVELEDLVGYGTLGLVNAVDRFDPTRGILLKTYAEHRIRGAILDGLRGMDWLPRGARQKERQERQDGSGDVSSLAQPASGVPRMQAVINGGGLGDLEKLAQFSQAHSYPQGYEGSPETQCARKEKFDQLSRALLRLPRRHRVVLDLYYRSEMSMKQIGERLRIHESRVSQLHAAAIGRLRKTLDQGAVAVSQRKGPGRMTGAL